MQEGLDGKERELRLRGEKQVVKGKQVETVVRHRTICKNNKNGWWKNKLLWDPIYLYIWTRCSLMDTVLTAIREVARFEKWQRSRGGKIREAARRWQGSRGGKVRGAARLKRQGGWFERR